MSTDIHPHHAPADIGDKVFTYRWFVAGLRLVILVNAAAAIFALLGLFTSASWMVAAIVAILFVGVGARLIMGTAHLEEPPSGVTGS